MDDAEDSPADFDDPVTMPTVAMSHAPMDTGGLALSHVLVETHAEPRPRHHTLVEGTAIIGRRSSSFIHLDISKVSSEHCQLSLRNGLLTVTDLNSTNGTYLGGKRIEGETAMSLGAVLTIGGIHLMYEVRALAEAESEQALQSDLENAAGYIAHLLPAALEHAHLEIQSLYKPCAMVGGDAFGYSWLDKDLFACYLLDVSGHGVEAALHASAVMNTLNNQGLPDVNFACPDEVLKGLNRMFRMTEHGNKYFTIWYGVYAPADRELRFAGGGHPAPLLFDGSGAGMRPLVSRNPGVGLIPEARFLSEQVDVSPGSQLLIYSDGVYETIHDEEGEWGWESLAEALKGEQAMLKSGPSAVFDFVRALPGAEILDDDFTLVQMKFR